MVDQLPPLQDKNDTYQPVFKAVNVESRRRGLRLEKGFWSVLDHISKQKGLRISDIVHQLDLKFPSNKNTASILRVYALNWLEEQYKVLNTGSSLKMLQAQITACPSPNFVLSSQTGLTFYNAAFIQYIRTNVPVFKLDTMHSKIQLKIDMNTTELINKLQEKGVESVSLGFVIGLDNRHIRGQLKAALAFAEGEYFVVGYINI